MLNLILLQNKNRSLNSSNVAFTGFSKYFWIKFISDHLSLSKLLNISNLDSSIVFFISPKKINKNIQNIKQFFSDRKILICREISKFYEEHIRMNVIDIQPFEKIPKGEITLVLSEKVNNRNISIKLEESDKKNIKKMIKTLSVKDITNLISENKNISKKDIYNYCLKLKNEK